MTTDTDAIVGTTNDDVITGEYDDLDGTDVILDETTTDNDTLTLTIDSALAANDFDAVTGIENVNLIWDDFANDATSSLSDFTGTNVTVSSTVLGFSGAASLSNVAKNSVTAGTGVTDLAVSGLTTGTVDAGSATTVGIATAAATDEIALTVNGDVTSLTAGTSTDLTLTATAAAEVTLTSLASTTVVVEGAVDVTLVAAEELDTDTLTNNLTAGTLTAVVSATADGSAWDVDNVQIDTAAVVYTAAGDIVAEITTADLGTVEVAGSTAAATDTATISTAVDAGVITASTLLDSVTLNLTDAVTIDDVATLAVDLTVNVSDDVTLTDVSSTGDVVIAGTGDVIVTDTAAASIDGSDLTGGLTLTNATTNTSFQFVGGSGDNDVTLGAMDSSVTTQAGDDTVVATAIAGAGVAFSAALGAGDDSVSLDTPVDTVAIDFGTGSADQLNLGHAADLTGATLTLAGLEIVNLVNATVDGADTVTVDVDSSMLTGQAYTVSTAETADTATVNVTGDGATIDLGSLTVTNIDEVVITAKAAVANTITGTSTVDTVGGSAMADVISTGAGDDEITAGGGADVLTGGADADTFIFATGNSTVAATASITDFNLTEFDVLETVLAGVVADDETTGVDVSGADADVTATDITAKVSNGILTIAGDDAAVIDTLAEWVAVATTAGVLEAVDGDGIATAALAFEFDGNTYVYEETVGTMDNIIELTDLTDIVALGTAAAIDTLVLA